MITVSVFYPNDPATTFDEGYYMRTHIPLVRERWSGMGLRDVKVLKGLPGPDGSPAPFRIMATLTWESGDALANATRAHGKEIFGDIPNFTSGKPVMQLSQPLG